MARSPKDHDEDEPVDRKVVEVPSATTSLGSVLRAANASTAAQPPAPKPARGIPAQPRLPPRSEPENRARELAARKRVAALISGGVHFKIKREVGRIRGERGSGSSKLAARVGSKHFLPEVTLDLRAQPTMDTEEAITNFVGGHHRRGVRQFAIVFDVVPGADEGVGQIDAVIKALTHGRIAALVRAFSCAHESRGGVTTLAVLLI